MLITRYIHNLTESSFRMGRLRLSSEKGENLPQEAQQVQDKVGVITTPPSTSCDPSTLRLAHLPGTSAGLAVDRTRSRLNFSLTRSFIIEPQNQERQERNYTPSLFCQ